MEKFMNLLTTIDDYVWGLPLIIAILAVGLLLTIRLHGLQFRKTGLGFHFLFPNQATTKKIKAKAAT